MSSNITLRNITLQSHNKHNALLNLYLYNKQNLLLTVDTVFLNYSLLINITDNNYGLYICLYAFSKCHFYTLIKEIA